MDNMLNKSTLKGNDDDLTLAKLLADELTHGGCQNVTLLDTDKIIDWSRYMIIGTFTSLTQGLGLLQHCEDLLKKEYDILPRISKADRHSEAGWLLLDAGDIVINLMNAESRAFYALEEIWKKAAVLFKAD